MDIEEGMMWVLKPLRGSQEYDERKRKAESDRDARLQVIRERAEDDLRRLFVWYHEEVPGDPPSSAPTYPLRGSTEWKKV